MTKFKKIFVGIWIGLTIFVIGYFLMNPDVFTPENLANIFNRFEGYILIAYFFISLIRGVFLLPSSPFVIAGAFLFPDNLIAVFIISLVGIFFVATLLYYFPSYFGFDAYLKKKYGHRFDQIEKKINHPQAFWFVVAWSAFPLVPTDLICYIAGSLRMNYKKFFLGMAIGEIPLVGFYVFFTQQAMQFFGVH